MNSIEDGVSISLLNWDGGATGLAVENPKVQTLAYVR